MSYRRKISTRPNRLRQYKPLIFFGSLGIAMFFMLGTIKYALCDLLAKSAPKAVCNVNFGWPTSYLPLMLIGVGVVGTVWNLAFQRDGRSC